MHRCTRPTAHSSSVSSGLAARGQHQIYSLSDCQPAWKVCHRLSYRYRLGEKRCVWKKKKKSIPWIKNCLTKAHTYCCSAWIQTPSCLCKGAQAATWAVLTSSRDLSHSGRRTHPMCLCANKTQSLKSLSPSASIDLLPLLCDRNRFNVGNQ